MKKQRNSAKKSIFGNILGPFENYLGNPFLILPIKRFVVFLGVISFSEAEGVPIENFR